MAKTSDGRMALALPDADWAEIYHALGSKIVTIDNEPQFDRDPKVRKEWLTHLRRVEEQLEEQMSKHGVSY